MVRTMPATTGDAGGIAGGTCAPTDGSPTASTIAAIPCLSRPFSTHFVRCSRRCRHRRCSPRTTHADRVHPTTARRAPRAGGRESDAETAGVAPRATSPNGDSNSASRAPSAWRTAIVRGTERPGALRSPRCPDRCRLRVPAPPRRVPERLYVADRPAPDGRLARPYPSTRHRIGTAAATAARRSAARHWSAAGRRTGAPHAPVASPPAAASVATRRYRLAQPPDRGRSAAGCGCRPAAHHQRRPHYPISSPGSSALVHATENDSTKYARKIETAAQSAPPPIPDWSRRDARDFDLPLAANRAPVIFAPVSGCHRSIVHRAPDQSAYRNEET
eukprot:ctg_536.g276